MTDKSWMLNPKAIRHAKECIQLVHQRSGIKLRLSQEDFLHNLHLHVEASECAELGEAYARLISMAGVGFVIKSLPPKRQQQSEHSNVQVFRAVGAEDLVMHEDEHESAAHHSAEMVEYGGRLYPKFRSGMEFKGLYRGQPRYS